MKGSVMKNKIICIVILGIVLVSGCDRYDSIDSKPGEAIPPVTNLEYSIAGEEVHLNWQLPATIPGDIIKPVSVFIIIKVDGQAAGERLIEGAPTNYIYAPYDSSRAYQFTVKVRGEVDSSDPGVSHLRYSLGQTISIE